MKPRPNADPLLTPGQVAEIFNVDPKTVTRWASAGKLVSIVTPGGHHRFRKSEVDAVLHGKYPPIVDAAGDPVLNADPTDHALRDWMAGRLPVPCGHYIAASEARVGIRECERCLLARRHKVVPPRSGRTQ